MRGRGGRRHCLPGGRVHARKGRTPAARVRPSRRPIPPAPPSRQRSRGQVDLHVGPATANGPTRLKDLAESGPSRLRFPREAGRWRVSSSTTRAASPAATPFRYPPGSIRGRARPDHGGGGEGLPFRRPGEPCAQPPRPRGRRPPRLAAPGDDPVRPGAPAPALRGGSGRGCRPPHRRDRRLRPRRRGETLQEALFEDVWGCAGADARLRRHRAARRPGLGPARPLRHRRRRGGDGTILDLSPAPRAGSRRPAPASRRRIPASPRPRRVPGTGISPCVSSARKSAPCAGWPRAS